MTAAAEGTGATPRSADGWLLGVDSGGSGLRVALARLPADGHADGGPPEAVGTVTCPEPVRTGPAGIDAAHLSGQLVPAVRALLADAGAAHLAAACVGAAGMATLGTGLRAELPGVFAAEFGVRRLALAADAVTGYAGALGERPGAVVAAGTGMIAMGTDLTTWRRADGWGHLLGDCGSGAWIGRAGLEAALRAFDGRTGGSRALRRRAEAVFGTPLSALPGHLYPRTDRAAVLASFAPEVARCAAEDAVAAEIVRAAAREIAAAAEAVCPVREGTPRPAGAPAAAREPAEPRGRAVRVAFTGGLFKLGEALQGPLRTELAERLPEARIVEAAGGPLEGALLVAARLAGGALALPRDPALLSVAAPDAHGSQAPLRGAGGAG
ncbi:BadF/BadG/BcrA/BcrD ATPase family protein [Streptomyces sp. WMMB303]|uniref:N-acetylglucosamine kinase n=1 Tax=Streptomyces sp. WMMB303 TaxID=3034154 RepID=UPI0023EBC42F|nr:BadF/BadG/BcrA/BcrD ATPase family protein [Streptomyces sp. WMMB303]MDF4252045.1 BadF/BadG/BcrA/BcrD ATPase family protein [Streptomyces sp. WMMB303]